MNNKNSRQNHLVFAVKMERCPHENCIWLPIIKKFINIDYMPKSLCEAIYKISNSFSCRSFVEYNGDNIRHALKIFNDHAVKSINSNIDRSKDIRDRVQDIVLTLYTEQDQSKRREKMKSFESIMTEFRDMNEEHIRLRTMHKATITDLMRDAHNAMIAEDCESIGFGTQIKKPVRRQRDDSDMSNSSSSGSEGSTYDWVEETETDMPILDRKYEMVMDEYELKECCSHKVCVWGRIWNFLKANSVSSVKGKITRVPIMFCREMVRISRMLNGPNVVKASVA